MIKFQAKLIDFGLSTILSKNEKAIDYCGTPSYMAPEIILRHNYDNKVDVWSLGIILCLLLTIEFPFYNDDRYAYEANILT